ncbi:MAG TPA: hypothetical protein VKS21_13935, partial [Spirochaetota bacterium]|nr:hypothetical protein [Spirochaetota bacterium]
CYNDALFYIAQIYKIRGNKNAAEDYLDKLNKTSVRDRVYDVKHKKWVKPQTAYNHYMAQLTSKPRRTYDRPLDSLAKKIEEINNEIVGGRKKPDTGEAVFEQSSAPAAETTADEAEIEVQEDALDSALEEGSASSAGFDTGGVSSASSAASRSSASGQPETSSEGGDLDTEGESLDDEELDSVGNIDAEESSESSSAAEEETKEEKSDDSFDDEFVL